MNFIRLHKSLIGLQIGNALWRIAKNIATCIIGPPLRTKAINKHPLQNKRVSILSQPKQSIVAAQSLVHGHYP